MLLPLIANGMREMLPVAIIEVSVTESVGATLLPYEPGLVMETDAIVPLLITGV